jgi:hypothetical protein
VPVQPAEDQNENGIPLGEAPPPEQYVSRRTTKSDGGSVGSNLKNLQLDERRGVGPPTSPPATARTKRAAEPSGQVPDGVSRPSKRQGLKDQSGLNIGTDMTVPQDNTLVTASSQPGGIKLTQEPQSRTFNHPSSVVASVSINNDYVEPEGKMLLQPETRPITQDQLVNGMFTSRIFVGIIGSSHFLCGVGTPA